MTTPGIGHNGGPPDTEKMLADARAELIRQLHDKLKSGEATIGEMKLLREVLKDNGMVFTPGPGNSQPTPGAPTAPVDTLADPEYLSEGYGSEGY